MACWIQGCDCQDLQIDPHLHNVRTAAPRHKYDWTDAEAAIEKAVEAQAKLDLAVERANALAIQVREADEATHKLMADVRAAWAYIAVATNRVTDQVLDRRAKGLK